VFDLFDPFENQFCFILKFVHSTNAIIAMLMMQRIPYSRWQMIFLVFFGNFIVIGVVFFFQSSCVN